MELFKKDWMYDSKCVVATFAAGMIGLGVAFLLFSGSNSEAREMMYQGYEQGYTMVVAILSAYPMFVFRAVCPQMGSDKLYINTVNLPLSKKELFFKGMKSCMIIWPGFILFGALVVAALSEQSNSFGTLYMFALIKPLSVMVFMLIMNLQVISAVIFSLTRRIKWYKIVPVVIILDGGIIALCALVVTILNIDTAHFGCGIGIILAIVLPSIAVFLVAWRGIENVHR